MFENTTIQNEVKQIFSIICIRVGNNNVWSRVKM